MRGVQIVPDGRRAGERALIVGAGDEVVDQVPVYADFGLDEVALVGEFEGENRRGVLGDEHVVGADRVAGVDEGEYAKHIASGADEGHDALAVTHWPAL